MRGGHRLKQLARQSVHALFAVGKSRITNIDDSGPIAYPVEFDDGDKSIFDYVLSNNLTMVGRVRLISTLLACKHVCSSKVEGDFVECGVWRGGNSIVAADVFDRMGEKKQVYLFDTFAGMTEPTAIDQLTSGEYSTRERFIRDQREAHNEWCYASLEEVVTNFRRCGLLDKARFVKGDVLRTLADKANIPQKICILRLDTDWYESTKIELQVLWPRLQNGGILIIDDYGYWRGTKAAVDEFFAGSPRPFLQYVDDAGRVAIKY
jgi:O-methyltransferase